MDRRVKDGLRAGATAVGVSAGLLVLAFTAQTPDGFVHASFGGPLDVFGKSTSDVLSIGDGASDATELAALLQAPGIAPGSTPNQPLRVTVQTGEGSGATTVKIVPDIDPAIVPTIDDPAPTPPKPAVDRLGRVDCTGSVSCKTDPVTKTTTVTYPDGIVAVVQKVDDLTVVAYRRVGGNLRTQVQALVPAQPDTAPPDTAAPVPAAPPLEPATDPSQTASLAPAPLLPEQQQPTTIPMIDPGPPAPDSVTLGPAVHLPRGPKVDVRRPPLDFSSGDLSQADQPAPPPTKPTIPGLGKVKDALDSVVDAVKDGIGRAVGPGASGKANDAGEAGNSGNKRDAGANSP